MTTHPAQPTVIGGLSPDALSSLFQAIAGLHNFRAAAAMLSGLLVGGLLSAIPFLGAFAGFAIGNLSMFVGVLVFFIFVFIGGGAGTVLLMDQARGVPVRRFSDAMVYGLICIPKVIVLLIGFTLAALGVFIVLAIIFFLCKIPGLGPTLFTIAFPLAVVVAGVTVAGLYLGLLMASVALYDGATVGRAMSQSFAILRSRLVESLVLISVVMLLSLVVAGIVFGVLFAGFLPIAALSASIIGVQDFGSVMSVFGGGFRGGLGGGGSGHMIAGAIGTGVLWALALTLVNQVAVLGIILVYLRVSEGLDTSATESAMMQRFDEARRKAADMGQRAKEAAERARVQAQTAANARSAEAVAIAPRAPMLALTCPKCQTAITTDDAFCGVCGHKLHA